MIKNALALAAALLAAPAAAAPADQAAVVQGNTSFALQLYSRLASRPGNLFFSPYSISSALAMTYGGAAGHTAEEMAKTLRLDLPSSRLHAAFGGLNQALNEGGKKGGYSLSVANALWGQRGAAFLAPFLDLVKRGYGAGLSQLDFKGDAEGARKSINGWVEQKTSGRIKDLIAPGVLNHLTQLVLTNAIYFKGKWEKEFKAGFTSDEPFYAVSGKQVKARLMRQTTEFGYFDGGTFQQLEMPYQGQDLAMVVLLPRDKYGLAALEQTLSAEALQDWSAKVRRVKVQVHLPKFKMTEQIALAKELKALGMSEAFDKQKADFAPMNGKRPPDAEALSISEVIHKAFVEVNEEGTEAAAATAVVMQTLGMSAHPRLPPPPVFRADHPFLFLIRDLHSGSILFLGRVVDPKA
ncbi:MAG: serpin family protein [Elusimicrobia bacterium]|nr:serpin family protein [Elusimicrobiota bacterium]